jgi:nicotinate-nucleotide adenylyltransferase
MMAEAVRSEYELEKVIFIPASVPPHKRNRHIAPAEDRYRMAVLATESNPYFAVSDMELRRPGPSYSIDTVRAFQEKYGEDTDFFFIIGADVIPDMGTWNRIEKLLEICEFVAAQRPGCNPNEIELKKQFGELGEKHIHTLETPEFEISSTDIRERLRKGHSIRYIVPPKVEEYIYQKGLYKDEV